MMVHRNFSQFMTQSELMDQDAIVAALEESYQNHNGWRQVRGVEGWRWLLQKATPSNARKKVIQPDNEWGLLPPGRHPPPPDRRHPYRGAGRVSGPAPIQGVSPHPPILGNASPISNRPIDPRPLRGRPDPLLQPHPITEGAEDLLNLPARLCLLSREKKHISGQYFPDERYAFREISVNGEIVGLLGLQIIQKRRHPLEMAFLTSQKRTFLWMGLGIFFAAAFTSYGLARQLLRPIRQLMKGIEAMKRVDFDLRMDVKSNDELGKLADNFNAMAHTLKQYEIMRKQWISDISHELRTPISILQAKIESVQDGIRKMTPEMVDTLHQDVLRLGKLVEDLHTLSVTDSEGLSLRTEPINLVETLQSCIDGFRIQCEKRRIFLNLTVPTHEKAPSTNHETEKRNGASGSCGVQKERTDSIIVQGDRESIHRLFSNLMSNSLRYTDSPGELNISISQYAPTSGSKRTWPDAKSAIPKHENRSCFHEKRTWPNDLASTDHENSDRPFHDKKGNSKKQHVIVTFEDSAPGVPDDALPRIFDRLYRVDKSRSRELGGSGLGLSICKQIVQQHRGEITAAHSSLGGLSITVEFPMESS